MCEVAKSDSEILKEIIQWKDIKIEAETEGKTSILY